MTFVKAACLGMLAGAYATVGSTDPVYSIDAHIVVAGTSARADSRCLRLRATIAEPVAGFASSADYVLGAGFRIAAPERGDDIFFSGFEDCAP
jgi:hypothetical protein